MDILNLKNPKVVVNNTELPLQLQHLDIDLINNEIRLFRRVIIKDGKTLYDIKTSEMEFPIGTRLMSDIKDWKDLYYGYIITHTLGFNRIKTAQSRQYFRLLNYGTISDKAKEICREIIMVPNEVKQTQFLLRFYSAKNSEPLSDKNKKLRKYKNFYIYDSLIDNIDFVFPQLLYKEG